MVTLLEAWTNGQNQYAGLSTDTKPTTDVKNGDSFLEIDTGKSFMFNEDSAEWVEQPASGGGSDLPDVSSIDNGKILGVVNGEWDKMTAPSGLPSVSASDNGKVLGVANGEWDVVADQLGLPVVQIQRVGIYYGIQFSDGDSDLIANHQPFVLQQTDGTRGICMWAFPSTVGSNQCHVCLIGPGKTFRDVTIKAIASHQYVFMIEEMSSGTIQWAINGSPLDALAAWPLPTKNVWDDTCALNGSVVTILDERIQWRTLEELEGYGAWLSKVYYDVEFDAESTAAFEGILQYGLHAALQGGGTASIYYEWTQEQAELIVPLLWDAAIASRTLYRFIIGNRALVSAGGHIIDSENYLAEIYFQWQEMETNTIATAYKFEMAWNPTGIVLTSTIIIATQLSV